VQESSSVVTGAFETASAVYASRMSTEDLLMCTLSDDDLEVPDTTYESTVLLPLPPHVGTDTAILPQDANHPEVATQTSMLLSPSSYSVYSRDEHRCSDTKKADNLWTSGNWSLQVHVSK